MNAVDRKEKDLKIIKDYEDKISFENYDKIISDGCLFLKSVTDLYY